MKWFVSIRKKYNKHISKLVCKLVLVLLFVYEIVIYTSLKPLSDKLFSKSIFVQKQNFATLLSAQHNTNRTEITNAV